MKFGLNRDKYEDAEDEIIMSCNSIEEEEDPMVQEVFLKEEEVPAVKKGIAIANISIWEDKGNKKVGKVKCGESLDILEYGNGWAKIGPNRYVKTDLVKII